MGFFVVLQKMEPRRTERRFSVRSYVPADRDRVIQLFVKGVQENIETAPPDVRRVIEDSERKFVEWSLNDDLADIDAAYMACTTSPRSHFWVLVECIEGEQGKQQVIQGMVGLYRVDDDYATVRRLSIASAARRQGLARRLLDHIIDYASKEGFRRVILSTGQYLSASNALYTTYGFIKTKEEPDEGGTMENHYEYHLVPLA